MKRPLILALALAATLGAQINLRPPSVPLIAHDPYFSLWSPADTATATAPRHWTGTEQQMAAAIRIDGKPYRILGNWQRAAAPARQTKLEVSATRTTYSFEQDGVRAELTFLTPALMDDLDVLSRPLSYILFDVRSADSRSHSVQLYFDAGATLALNTVEDRSAWSRLRAGRMEVLRTGSEEQRILGKSGDNLRIDWGHFYLAAPAQAGLSTAITNLRARNEILESGRFPEADDFDAPSQPSRNQPVLAAYFDLGQVTAPVSRRLMAAYDDQFSIQYLQRNLRPYWRRTGGTAADLLRKADAEFESLRGRSAAFDAALHKELAASGGSQYADIAILAYRQALAAHKLVADINGTPLYFSKENFSNGCIATVDVTYPSAPLFLALNPTLLKGMLTPVLDYASLPRWRFPFAPHDLGTYPLANGQVYGGGELTEENQMPVEESGNMLILLAALAQRDGNAEYARPYWPLLVKWAAYLKEKGMDPDNQLSTDDFAGHLAHNTNLSIKAILALGGFSQLARMLGHAAVADEYGALAKGMAARWEPMAADGDHYRLAFDKPGTWSQKYNLVWDRLLGLNLFDPAIARKEVAFYLRNQHKYGLPLDNRSGYTKLDWITWSAVLAPDRAGFEALIAPVHKFLDESPSRVPMTDWYWTAEGTQRGFQARSVVGGVYLKLLAERMKP
ncbi:MAG: DUF4965 domain-containing protein [Bryobacterales bacterium]|nr:DUF4965 domain-containing protein [Bryobacterales bacterium]